MTVAGPACPRCGAPRTAHEPPTLATSGPVRATAEGRPPLTCATCGRGTSDLARRRAAVQRAVDARLVGAAGAPGAADCGACGTALDLPMRATSRALTVELDGTEPFTVTVALPLVRCGECATDNVPPELVTGVERTVATVCGTATPDAPREGPFSRLRRRAGRGSRGHP